MLSFLNVYAFPICSSPTDSTPTPFSLPNSLPPEIFSFLGTSTGITPPGTQKLLLTPVGRKFSIGSSSLTSFPSMPLAYLLFSIAPLAVAPLAVAPLLTFPFLPPRPFLLMEDAFGPGFKSPTNSDNRPSFSVFCPN